jgi:hypothetical protein
MKGFGGMQQLMRQANQMQNKLKKLQEELATQEFQGTSGGGAVTVTANGDCLVTKVIINPEVISAEDQELLQDMILSATNEAIKTAKEISEKEKSKITGGMSVPGF